MRIGGNGNPLVAPPWTTGRYYFLPNTTNVSTSATLGTGTLRAVPFFVPNQTTIKRLGAEVTSAGDANSKIRLGLYATGADGLPGGLVVDAGQIAGDSATVQEITGLSVNLGPGWYWAAAVVQAVVTTQPTVRTFAQGAGGVMPVSLFSIPTASQVAGGYLVTGVTGALPTTFGATDIHNSCARIFAMT